MIEALSFIAQSKAAPHIWKRAFLVGAFAFSISILVVDVFLRRKAGQDWNEALSGGSRLLTGNVWIDGGIFFFVIASIYVVLRYVVFRA